MKSDCSLGNSLFLGIGFLLVQDEINLKKEEENNF